MKRAANQRGFAVVEVILLIVVIGILGFVGYRAYKERQTKPIATTQSTVTVKPKPVDPTANWKTYTSTHGQFSFRYKPTWLTKNCPGYDFVFVGPKPTLGICNSDAPAQISISSTAGQHNEDPFAIDGYGKKAASVVRVDGVSGTRYSATVMDASKLMQSTEGTQLVVYLFYSKGHTYEALYTQLPSGMYSQKLQADFDLMVKNTLKFSAE